MNGISFPVGYNVDWNIVFTLLCASGILITWISYSIVWYLIYISSLPGYLIEHNTGFSSIPVLNRCLP